MLRVRVGFQEGKDERITVGAQSIACAQSIAPSLIGDNICEKNLNFWQIIFTEDRKGNSAANSWTKNHIFSFKSGK